jgi:hypothetical protein
LIEVHFQPEYRLAGFDTGFGGDGVSRSSYRSAHTITMPFRRGRANPAFLY